MENEKNKYKINWSYDTLIITSLVTVLLIFMIYKLLNNINILNAFILVVIFFTYLFSLSKMPINIELDEDKLILNKLLGKLEINISNIENMEMLKDNMGIRSFGIGGLFGFIGYFKNKKLGDYLAYVADTNNKFYIKLKNNKTYVFSCKNPNQLLSDIETVLH